MRTRRSTLRRLLVWWTLFSVSACLVVGAVGEFLEARDCANPDALCIGHGAPMFFVFFFGFWLWLWVVAATVLVWFLVRGLRWLSRRSPT